MKTLNDFYILFQHKLQAAEAESISLNKLAEEQNNKSPKKKDIEIDQLNFFIKRHQELISYLKKSLKRIDDKTYGICTKTGQLIEKEKLLALPHGKLKKNRLK